MSNFILNLIPLLLFILIQFIGLLTHYIYKILEFDDSANRIKLRLIIIMYSLVFFSLIMIVSIGTNQIITYDFQSTISAVVVLLLYILYIVICLRSIRNILKWYKISQLSEKKWYIYAFSKEKK